jgi:phosphate:Na+ symporter
VKLVSVIIPEKAGDDEDSLRLHYIDDRILQTPPIAVAQVKKEVKRMAENTKRNFDLAMNAVLTGDLSAKNKIRKTEDKINFLNKSIAAYLIKLSSVTSSPSDEVLIGSLHHVISDIERIGDHALNFIEDMEDMKNADIIFTPSALVELKSMHDKLSEMFDLALTVLFGGDIKKLPAVSAIENEINVMKKEYGNNHITRLNKGECTVENGPVFYTMISELERVGDHLTNIAFSIKSLTGSQREAMEILAKEHLV